MGVKKGTDNFGKFRSERAKANLNLIEFELEKQRRRRIEYPDFGALVSHISEKTGIHRTTLTRNAGYKRVLLNYLASQPGATDKVRDEDASPALLRAKLFDARLEIRNLKNQISIINKRLEKLGNGVLTEVDADNSKVSKETDWYLAFNDTAMLLKLLIERLNSYGETIKVDLDKKQIIDLSAPSRDRILSGPERTRWFADFYRKVWSQENPVAKGK